MAVPPPSEIGMTFLAQLVVLASLLLAPVPKQRGMDRGTIAACEKLGAVYGTMRTLTNGRIEFLTERDDPEAVGLPAFDIRGGLKGPLPDFQIPYGLVANSNVGLMKYCEGSKYLNGAVLNYAYEDSLKDFERLAELPALRHLRIDDASVVNDAAMAKLGGLTELVSLDLQTNTMVTTAGWKNLGRLKKLEVLLLPAVEIPLAELAAVADPKKLRSLEVWVTDEKECIHLRRFENLESLTLGAKNPNKLGDGGIGLIGPLKKLRRFDASHTHVADGAMETLAASKELRELRLARTSVTDFGFKALSDLVKLQVLDLTSSHVVGAGLGSFPELTHLRLTHVRVSKEGGLALGTLQNLEYLHLGLGDPSFEALDAVARLPKLKSLDLNMTRTTDDVLKNLKCKATLERLMVPNTLITDEGVIALKGCKKLTYLHVENTRLTDACLPTLIGLPLRHVEMARTNITSKHLDEFLLSKTLVRLNLNATRVTPAELQAFEVANPKRLFR